MQYICNRVRPTYGQCSPGCVSNPKFMGSFATYATLEKHLDMMQSQWAYMVS